MGTAFNVSRNVDKRRGLDALAQSAAIFDLSRAETGRLFGVSRQAVDAWYRKGVPVNRIASVERVAEIARALQGRFIPERIPEIARERIPGLRRRSILEAIRVVGPANVLDMLDRAFSYVPR